MKTDIVKLTLCICTRNRPDELSRCLDTIFQGGTQPDEIIVSDDSTDNMLTRAVCDNFSGVSYQRGPCRGLGPNRNACIRSASGTHLWFVDDDVRMPPDCVKAAYKLISDTNENTIMTGFEINYRGEEVFRLTPHNADFWGLQRVPAIKNQYRSLVINSTIFPARLFHNALFDERVRYGSEEIDMARHAIALGYQICYCDQFFVEHHSSLINRDEYRKYIDASRLFVTTKAYWKYERSWWKTAAFLIMAPVQLVGSAIRKRSPGLLWHAMQSITLAIRYLSLAMMEKRSKAPMIEI